VAGKKLFNAKAGKQISIFIENRPGSLAEVIDLLGESGFNMIAMSLSEGLELGYLRIVVDKHDEAKKVLHAKGHLVLDRDIILVEVANEPGGLASAIDKIVKAGINVEYAYSANSLKNDHSMIVIRVNDVAKALKAID
jgi:hypothetical protein